MYHLITHCGLGVKKNYRVASYPKMGYNRPSYLAEARRKIDPGGFQYGMET